MLGEIDASEIAKDAVNIKQVSKAFNHIAVTGLGDENVRRVTVSEMCTINLEDIDKDIKHNVTEFVWWSQAYARAVSELAELNQRKDTLKARIRKESARLRLMAYSPQGLRTSHPDAKINESTVDAWIEVNPVYQSLVEQSAELNKLIYEKEHTVNTMNNMREGFKMKAKLLSGLCVRRAGGSASDIVSDSDL